MTGNAVDDAIHRLLDSGLEEKEARIAVSLAGREPLKASEIGSLVGLTRMDAYNTLRRLQEMGIVRATVDRPMRFIGSSISDIFQHLITREELELQRLREHLEELEAGDSDVFISMPPSVQEATFTVIKERGHIHAMLQRLIDDAEDDVMMMLGPWGILHICRSPCLEALNMAAARGVKVRVLAQLDAKTNRFFDELSDSIEIRHCDDSTAVAAFIDSEVALQSMSIEANPVGRGRSDSALVIESKEFLLVQRELAESVWGSAIDLKSARSRIISAQMVEPLRISLGEGSFYHRLREGVLGAVDDGEDTTKGWSNAILRHQGEAIDGLIPSRALELMGVQLEPILRNIGHRIGEEIALMYSHIEDNDQFNKQLIEIWCEMGMGELSLNGDPPLSVIVKDAGACGGRPDIGGMFCHLDEGILGGIIEARYGTTTTTVQRTCQTEDKDHCHYDIHFEDKKDAHIQ